MSTSRRILIVTDDQEMWTLLSYNLEAAGFSTFSIERGDAAATYLDQGQPELVILEWALRGLSGLELCRRLRVRSLTRELPIIMIGEQNDESDRLGAFDAGVDDYVIKPFSMAEFIARVGAVLRRAAAHKGGGQQLVNDFVLDRANRRLYRRGRLIHLSPTEFALLDYLMQRPGQVYSREHLVENLRGNRTEIIARAVDVHIGRLRRAINVADEQDPIITVRGEGYAFDGTYGR